MVVSAEARLGQDISDRMVTFDHPASSSTAREESEGEESEGEEIEGEESEGEEMMAAMAAVKVE